jgi:hypothetical protein
MLMHANHANRAQQGRGTGSKGMLERLTTLDVRELQPWQLEEAQTVWRDFRGRYNLLSDKMIASEARRARI